MDVSIVINTYNRAPQLEECLSALRLLDYSPFEVIVVNGPSTDSTKEVCEKYKDFTNYADCAERNLSVSRNIGIAHAQGEIVAFIDDDALVHQNWLKAIIASYTRPDIVGVGGGTIDHTGKDYQATATLCDVLGNAYSVPYGISQETFSFTDTCLFPSLLGTNSTFRKSALEEIGGFDETFAYLLDETDVCLRLTRKGGKILYAPHALIFHRYAPSHLRNQNRVPGSLRVQARSKAYFIYRHGTGLPERTREAEIGKYKDELRKSNKWLQEHNHITPAAEAMLNLDVELGVADGRAAAAAPAPTNLQQRLARIPARKFKTFRRPKDRLRIALVSQGFPPSDTAGIARWTSVLARGLAKNGHCVHVVTRAQEGHDTVTYQDEYWVHRISPDAGRDIADFPSQIDLPGRARDWSSAVYRELCRIGFDNLDLVSVPIWDVEGLIPVLLSPIPVITSLHTTYKVAYPFKEDWHRPLYKWNHVDKIARAETFIFNNGRHFLGNSSSIVGEINAAYGTNISERTTIVPHGVDDVSFDYPSTSNGASQPVTVLFVGRQESRKGFDTAIRAAALTTRINPNVIFRFVGDSTGDRACQDALRKLREMDPPSASFRFDGYISDEELDQAYRDCDIFLCPSRYESFGLIAIEAMRFAKPVIAGRVGGLAEVVEHQKDGILVDPDDAKTMADAILKLAADQRLRATMGRAARTKYELKYTSTAMAAGVEAAYRGFLSRERQKSREGA